MARTARAPIVPEVDKSKLSEQQRQICELAGRGMTVREIAEAMGITPHQVTIQISRIKAKANKVNTSGTSSPSGSISVLEGLSEFDSAHLTGHQQEVIGFLRNGRRTRDIARHYGITTRAVRAARRRAERRLKDLDPTLPRISRLDEDLKAECAERYGDRDPFRPEPSDEEKARRQEFDKRTAGWVYSLITGNIAEGYDPGKLPRGCEAWKALGREGHGGAEARRAIAGARSKRLKVIAAASRHELVRVESAEDRRLLQDVLARYFRELDSGVYLEMVGGAKSMLTKEYIRRRR